MSPMDGITAARNIRRIGFVGLIILVSGSIVSEVVLLSLAALVACFRDTRGMRTQILPSATLTAAISPHGNCNVTKQSAHACTQVKKRELRDIFDGFFVKGGTPTWQSLFEGPSKK